MNTVRHSDGRGSKGDGMTERGARPMPHESPSHVADALAELWARFGRKGATSESVHTTLREAILSQALPPGARLGEEELAGYFSLSRTPIREAILRLEAEGLVDRGSGRPAVVTELRPAEIIEIYEVRAVIDALAAELAAQRITPPGLSTLEWANQQMKLAGERGDFAKMAVLNLEFHEELARCSQNTFLLHTLRTVHDRVRRFPGTTFSHRNRWQTAIEEHDAILEALRAGDAQASFERARHHMTVAREIRIAMLNDADRG